MIMYKKCIEHNKVKCESLLTITLSFIVICNSGTLTLSVGAIGSGLSIKFLPSLPLLYVLGGFIGMGLAIFALVSIDLIRAHFFR